MPAEIFGMDGIALGMSCNEVEALGFHWDSSNEKYYLDTRNKSIWSEISLGCDCGRVIEVSLYYSNRDLLSDPPEEFERLVNVVDSVYGESRDIRALTYRGIDNDSLTSPCHIWHSSKYGWAIFGYAFPTRPTQMFIITENIAYFSASNTLSKDDQSLPRLINSDTTINLLQCTISKLKRANSKFGTGFGATLYGGK